MFTPAAALTAEGELIVVAPQKAPEAIAADEVAVYEAKKNSTLRNDQRKASSEVLRQVLEGRSRPERIGVEFSTFCPHLAETYPAALLDIEPALYEFRRRKDPDEMAKLKKAIAATGRMYERARQIIDAAETEARRMRHEVEDFCDQKLAGFEIVLERTTRMVQAGREKLQGNPLAGFGDEIHDEEESDLEDAFGVFDQDDSVP